MFVRLELLVETHQANFQHQFDCVAIAFCAFALAAWCAAMATTSARDGGGWTPINLAIGSCFCIQLIVQFWAIHVVKDCYHFVNLLYVLISIAD